MDQVSRSLFMTGGMRTLTSQSFNFYQSWTVPAGVTNLETVQGVGENGVAGGWYNLGAINSPTVSYVEQSAPAGISSGTIESRAQAEWDKFPTSYNVNGQSVSWTLWYYYVNRTDEYARTSTIRLKNGFSKTKAGNGWGVSYTTNGSTLPSPFYYSYEVGNMEEFVNTTTGQSTTAFGLTFPGGTGGPGSITTYTNVAVTPGQTYTLSIPSGGGASLVVYYYN